MKLLSWLIPSCDINEVFPCNLITMIIRHGLKNNTKKKKKQFHLPKIERGKKKRER